MPTQPPRGILPGGSRPFLNIRCREYNHLGLFDDVNVWDYSYCQLQPHSSLLEYNHNSHTETACLANSLVMESNPRETRLDGKYNAWKEFESSVRS